MSGTEIGEKVWRRLIAGGGFVWTTGDGEMRVCFNKGYAPTKELAALVKEYKRELRLYVEDMHRRQGSRSSDTPGKVLPAKSVGDTG